MEWKLLIPFNDKSDGIFQINQHPSTKYFVTWRSTAPKKELVSDTHSYLTAIGCVSGAWRPPFDRRKCPWARDAIPP